MITINAYYTFHYLQAYGQILLLQGTHVTQNI